jgi:hypothetical protein
MQAVNPYAIDSRIRESAWENFSFSKMARWKRTHAHGKIGRPLWYSDCVMVLPTD